MKLMKNSMVMVALSSLLVSSVALANPPKPNVYDGGNKWRITFYNDSTVNHDQWGDQEICFLPYAVVGTSIQGVWYSTTYTDWNGLYYQEGDELKMTGDYAKDVGHDHMTLQHTTYDVEGQVRGMAFKDWTEWREDGAYGNIIGWGNSNLVRAGRCDITRGIDDIAILTAEERKKLELVAQEFSATLPRRLTVKGTVASSPGQHGLESVDEYLQRTGVK